MTFTNALHIKVCLNTLPLTADGGARIVPRGNPIANEFLVAGDEAELRIVQRDGSRHIVLLDARDVAIAQRHHWHILSTGPKWQRRHYANNRGVGPLHFLLFDALAPAGPAAAQGRVQFLNGDSRDCRRRNLVRRSVLRAHEMDEGTARSSVPAAACPRAASAVPPAPPARSFELAGRHAAGTSSRALGDTEAVHRDARMALASGAEVPEDAGTFGTSWST